MDEVLTGLPPVVAPDCHVLVLGSMPGAASLQAARYYAHPRNRFWPVMAALTGVAVEAPYEERLAASQRAGIGLWDVIGECRRAGSLDSAIVRGSERPNPVAGLVHGLAALRGIALNGGTAASLFRRHIQPQLDDAWTQRVQIIALPSTSPAHAAMDLARLREAWDVLRPLLPASTVRGASRRTQP
ncbi:DNA-deoxyinosine glycosylase [Pseudoxanthomonas sp. Root65]|uniref:DNA-deoxyinosine glycosylase n=1 Tax=Pseudoxanthomonas sp. Root65 TaxID=1736576 RepID=UPI0006FFE4AF|nr:DNA-deoxyinosine glycosylase [Pseudoxanthomonas sp. Root65]KRA54416.1 DNA-deoxyinosine glycosylase [Pseudoxanthomonas sp. Root65]